MGLNAEWTTKEKLENWVKIVKKYVKLNENRILSWILRFHVKDNHWKIIRDINLRRKKSIPIRDNRDIINSIWRKNTKSHRTVWKVTLKSDHSQKFREINSSNFFSKIVVLTEKMLILFRKNSWSHFAVIFYTLHFHEIFYKWE